MEIEQETYDPAFYLPLFSSIFATNSVVPIHKVTQNGALSLVLGCLSSSSQDTRLAAHTVLARFYAHLEAGR